MGDLLQVVAMASLTPKKAPLLVEIPVNKAGAPFLVLGTKEWVWVKGAKTETLRAAVRKGEPPLDLESQVVSVVYRLGVDRRWGNSYPYTKEGLRLAVEYVRYFGIESIDVLVPSGCVLEVPKGVTRVESKWILAGRAVIVPTDRSFLGMIGTLGNDYYTGVVHNPSRGMAVLGVW